MLKLCETLSMALFVTSVGNSGKGDALYDVRELVKYDHLTLDGTAFLKAELDIPISGQRFGFGEVDPTAVYLTDRLVSERGEDSIRNLKKFPIEIHAYIVADKKTTNV